MKNIKIIPILVLLFLFQGNRIWSQNSNNKGFTLLELFTSEGCSSCPPADELLGRIENENNNQLYILAYHVDYWDRQGWKDIFSQAKFTERQYEYAKWLGKEPVYTPQAVVNGKKDLIGSNEKEIRTAIKNRISKSQNLDLSVESGFTASKLKLNYTLDKISKDTKLLIAVVQKSAKSNVKRGENANRILAHYQIVRELQSVKLTSNLKGTVTLNLPKDFNSKDFAIIGFVQNNSDGTILTADRINL
ncbi:DUF1223 domain-containing protein [Flavobacterium hungaricum]|uniref:DUF1223 domain-containing protein n=1 Tax=Flavobacterium hungaricum TaxID=2082725 RepID=A0ABR9TSG1_9FLAO|nr:DUF1223 domain-containing protein [Flavobacterium hungaricum]MBE8728285.1 DUF1223 domain-containing protein [Flavobacterium hungaricum]